MSAVLTVPVGLGARSYDVLVGAGALDAAAQRLPALFPRRRAILVTDSHVAPLHLERVSALLARTGIACEPIVMAPGERSKSFAGLEQLVDALLERNIERSEAIIALGGGVIGDLTGFAAAVTKRGVGFIQIPTTLLAQVDSSVGGKTGINTRQGKNFAGAFHQPRLVIADTGLLTTLPERERRAGYAEIIKAALIGDAAMFERLDAAGAGVLQGAPLAQAIADAVAFKARVVAEDELEHGNRALLNLGHTFAHAFEAEAPKDAIRHGEAVAAGIALAFRYSVARGECPASDAARVEAHLRAVDLPWNGATLAHKDWDAARLVNRMRDDKKNQAGEITLILARGIGKAWIDRRIDATHLVAFLETSLS